jgi:hypothetical protein
MLTVRPYLVLLNAVCGVPGPLTPPRRPLASPRSTLGPFEMTIL